MIDEIVGAIRPELKTTVRIIHGQLGEITKDQMRAWVKLVLGPVRDSVREVLDDPENKDLWCTQATCPTAEQCLNTDVAKLDDAEKFRLIGVAMTLHAGYDLDLDTAESAMRVVRQCYTSTLKYVRDMKEDFLNQPSQAARERSWLHDLICLGAATLDGTDLTLVPLDCATQLALDWIAENNRVNKTSLGPQGGTV